MQSEIIIYRLFRKCVKLSLFFLDNIYIRFALNCIDKLEAFLVADLVLFCYERDFMLSLSKDIQFDVIEAFNSASRYLDDLLNIDNN